ncbi:hypothetical protein EYC80_007587 [Monilinia laxa]|uniref:Uncharacterized protein n=1 Tax=Monilinia laxa TaxID=61186 RepID=A0A5N6JWF7_MONLA|nr:hypothetical protein EYC80_007587 [Monilinia laxa]
MLSRLVSIDYLPFSEVIAVQYQSNPQNFKALFPNLRISSEVCSTRTFNVAVFDDKMIEILKVHQITVSRGRLT